MREAAVVARVETMLRHSTMLGKKWRYQGLKVTITGDLIGQDILAQRVPALYLGT